MTDTCKNITFARFATRAVKNPSNQLKTFSYPKSNIFTIVKVTVEISMMYLVSPIDTIRYSCHIVGLVPLPPFS